MVAPSNLCADVAFVNGRVITVDEDDTVAEAVAVKGGRILRVGSDDYVGEVIGEGTEVHDLGSRTMLPGLIDSHMHPGSYGVFLVRGVPCGPDVDSVDELLQRIKAKAMDAPPGSWLLGYRLDNVRLGRYPTRWELDTVTPENPLYIQRRDGHVGVVNSLALEAAGITKDTPDPLHGKIMREESGVPTGVLLEAAKDLAYARVPEHTLDEYMRGLPLVVEELVANGLTTVHASMTDSKEFRAMQILRRSGGLGMRLCVHMSGREEGMLESLVASGIQTPFGDEWLKITEIEWVYDTSTSGRTAAYNEPYVGEPDNYGILLYDYDDIADRVRRAHLAGLRVGLDGIGDRGIGLALDAIEVALDEKPWPDHRHRIEHCCYVTPPIQDRLLKLGVIDASATGFIHDLGDAYQKHRGVEEMRWMWPHRTLIDRGIPAPGHSDCPVCSSNPWLGIYGMVTRMSSGGQVLYAGEGCTPMEAIRAYTIDGAYAAHEEAVKGSIEEGKLADMVVVDRDPLSINPLDLKNVETLMTIIHGEVVYRK